MLWLLASAGVAAQDAEPAAAAARVLRADSTAVVFWPGQSALAEQTLQAARAPLRLPGFGREVRVRGTVVLAPTREVLESWVGAAPEWAAGLALPQQRLIVLPVYRGLAWEPGVTLRHERVHLALPELLPGRIPRWFNEGYATWVSGGWDARSGWQIRLALARGQGPLLDSLALSWPRRAGQARLAYLLSASAVVYLAELGGPDGFAALMQAWQREGSLDRALRLTYGLTLGQFEKQWRAMVRRRYGWVLALSQTGVFWLVLVLLVLLLGTRRRRYQRERLERLRDEERMLPPAGGTGLDLPP